MIRAIIILTAMLLSSQVSAEREVSEEADTLTRVNYCLGVYEAWISNLNAHSARNRHSNVSEAQLRRLVVKFNRFSAYSKALTDKLSISSFDIQIAANEAGKIDVAACGQAMRNCSNKYRGANGEEGSMCDDVPACIKTDACEDFDISY